MPNWCANRLMFNGINNSDALKTWIAGGGLSLHRRARKEGIQLFLSGCAGILHPGQNNITRHIRSWFLTSLLLTTGLQRGHAATGWRCLWPEQCRMWKLA